MEKELGYVKEQPPNYSGFVVIGAGQARTGTMSLREALGKLLEGKCYHMLNVAFGDDTDFKFWDKVVAKKGDISKKEWVDFLQGRGFRAGVDYPTCQYYKELMEAFPEAKVVLTVRDAEKWYNSVKNSIFQAPKHMDNLAVKLYLMVKGLYNGIMMTQKLSYSPAPGFNKGLFTVIEEGKESSVQFFNKWTEEVKRTVPKDRLLVFEVKQGWEPLCKFLDLPIPDEPFPHVNDTKAVNEAIARNKKISFFLFYLIPFMLLAFLVYFFFF